MPFRGKNSPAKPASRAGENPDAVADAFSASLRERQDSQASASVPITPAEGEGGNDVLAVRHEEIYAALSPKEKDAKAEKEMRERMQQQALEDKAAFEKRLEETGGRTQPDELGHFAQLTASKKNNMSLADREEEMRSRRRSSEHIRESMGLDNEKQKAEWLKRRDDGALASKPETGHYAVATASGTRLMEKKEEDPTKINRTVISADLAEANKKWEVRKENDLLNTAPDADLGHFSTATEASKRQGKDDFVSVPSPRKSMELEGTLANDEWAKRREAGALDTEPNALSPRVAKPTASTKARKKETNMRRRQQHAPDPQTKAKRDFARRQAKKERKRIENLEASSAYASLEGPPASSGGAPAAGSTF